MAFGQIHDEQSSIRLSYRNAPNFCLIFDQFNSKVELYSERRGGITHVE